MNTWGVFSGSGAKVSFQIGVALELVERGVVFDGVVGVSGGAIVGAMLAQGRIHEAADLVLRMGEERVFERESIRGLLNPFNRSRSGLYDQSPLRELLYESINGHPLTMPFMCGAVDYQTGKYESTRFDAGDQRPRSLTDAVLRSSAIPVAFQPIPHHAGWHIDGGVRNNAPIGDAIAERPSRIIIVLASPPNPEPEPLPTDRLPVMRMVRIALRTIEVMHNEVTRADLRTFRAYNETAPPPSRPFQPDDARKRIAHDLWEPDVHLGNSLDFSRAKQEWRLEQGRALVRARN